jgi:hypothetical protein
MGKVPAYAKNQKCTLTGDKCQQHFKTLEEEFKATEIMRSGEAGGTEAITPVNKALQEIKVLRDEANLAKASDKNKKRKVEEENKLSHQLLSSSMGTFSTSAGVVPSFSAAGAGAKASSVTKSGEEDSEDGSGAGGVGTGGLFTPEGKVKAEGITPDSGRERRSRFQSDMLETLYVRRVC